jgi:hypothetical protein
VCGADALREIGTPSLPVALDHLELFAEVRPEKLEPAAVRWHGRLEVEAATMTLAESQLALSVGEPVRGRARGRPSTFFVGCLVASRRR